MCFIQHVSSKYIQTTSCSCFDPSGISEARRLEYYFTKKVHTFFNQKTSLIIELRICCMWESMHSLHTGQLLHYDIIYPAALSPLPGTSCIVLLISGGHSSHFHSHLNCTLAGFSDPYCMLGIVPGSRQRDRQIDGSVSSDEECSSPKPRRDRSALKKFSQVRAINILSKPIFL